MLSKAAKQEIIEDLSSRFQASPSMFVVEYKGLNVGQIESLRQQLKDANAELKVVKNTLLKRASEKTDIEQINDLFIGPTAVAICEQDSPKVAKIFVESKDDLPSLVIKGGIVEGKVVNVSEIEEISKLPSREELLAKLLGMLSAPMTNVVGTLKQMQTKVVYALNAVKETKTEE